MVTRCPPLAAEKLEQYQRDGTRITPDQTAELIYWASRVACPSGTVGILPEDAPVCVGGRVLWPLTMQAQEWLRWASEHFAGDMALACQGYACEHGRSEGAFDALYSPRSALATVKAWRRGFAGTPAQLRVALDALSEPPRREPPKPPDDDDDDPPPDLAGVLAEVVAATHLPAEYYRRHSGAHFLRVARAVAFMRAIDAGQRPEIVRPEDEALQQFGLLCMEIETCQK